MGSRHILGEMRPSNASLCSVPNVSIFEKRDKHSCVASTIINMSIVLIVDSLFSTLHASVNRIWCCEANAVSLFFLLGLPPSFLVSHLAASPLDPRALMHFPD